MEKSKRKEMEFQLRRTEILSQAEKIFAAKGFHNATMAEIASASGFATGTLYQFFEGKENSIQYHGERETGQDVF